MFSDWIREHIETNATKGGAPMAWCLCCLQGKRKGCKETNATREVRRWRGACVAFRAKAKGVVSLLLFGGFQCLRTRFVSTKRGIRTREVVCVVFRTKESGVVL
jgi:hypothetical protein